MSLHTLANHLQTAGRGDDKMLVHMTPHEVQGLQSLAMAHGGSLTINPHTGLPEAGFLSAILPMAAGALLGPAGIGMSAMQAGLVTGAAGAAISGSLGKGLMMGLGAYSGAGLGGSLMGGEAAATGAEGLGSASTLAAQNAANLQATATSQLGNTMGAPAATGAGTILPSAAPALTMPGVQATPGMQSMGGMNPSAVSQSLPSTPPPVVQSGAPNPAPGASSVQSALEKLQSAPGKLWDMLGNKSSDNKDQEDFLKQNKNYLLAGGLSALALNRPTYKAPTQPQEQMFNPNYRVPGGYHPSSIGAGSTAERNYGFYADGGVVGQQNNMPSSQVGQPIEKMSQLNSIGANTNFPMANIHPFGYAVPRNYPVSQNVFQPESYERVDPYTGEQKLASGGIASLHNYASGGFVSKLKPVAAPTKPAPKLQDVSKLTEQMQNLQKYGSYDDQMGKYNDLVNQIKDAQSQKTSKATDLANEQKGYNTDIANINASKANRLKELNTEYTNKINSFNADVAKDLKSKQADIANEAKQRQADIKSTTDPNERKQKQADFAQWQKDSSADLSNWQKDKANDLANIKKDQTSAINDTNNNAANDIKGRTNDFTNFKNDITNSNKELDAQIAQANKDQAVAKQAAAYAKQYESVSAQKDNIDAANQSAIDKANQAYEDAQNKYNDYQQQLADEKNQWQQETGRTATGISALRAPAGVNVGGGGVDNSAKIAELTQQMNNINGMSGAGDRSAIQQQINALKAQQSSGQSDSGVFTPKYTKDPKTGQLVLTSSVSQNVFQPFTKVPGFDTSTRIMDESDINNLFQDVAGRRPTQAEMDKYLGVKTTDAALASQITKLPDVNAKMDFTADDLKENFKYYIGRDPTKGELANMQKSNLTNFNAVRNYLQSSPDYLNNINKIAKQEYDANIKSQSEQAYQEASQSMALTPTDVSSTFKDVLGRPPTMDELNQYNGAHMDTSHLADQLKSSDAYLKTLTQPLVASATQGATPTSGSITQAPAQSLWSQILGGNAPSAATSAATSTYTPAAQAPSLGGGITSGMGSGLNAPLQRGQVTIQGAFNPNPDFNSQIGLSNLYNMLPAVAPDLQKGLQFAAPQQNPNFFGFNPYSGPSLEQQLIAAAQQKNQLNAPAAPAATGMAEGGVAGDASYNLGGYSDGGRLLKGPGDGVSDSIPATIGNRQPARLADGEFVVPARIVSELGNGSTDAGARKLYAMMQRIQQARGKTVGNNSVAVNSRADKFLPA